MDFSWKEILAFLGIVGAVITGGVPIFKQIAEMIEKKRKAREEKAAAHLSESAELRRIENEGRAAGNEYLLNLLHTYREECERLKAEVEERDKSASLSRPTITRLYASMRSVGRQIDNCETLLMRGESRENVLKEIEILRQKFAETESLLP